MGKRNRKSKVAARPSADPEAGMPKALKKETMDVVNLLLEKCCNQSCCKGNEWDEYVEVFGLIEKLRKKQSHYVLPHPDRENAFPAFLNWLQQNDVNTDGITIEKFDVGEYGVKANRDIKESELFMSIPYKAMITSLTAKSSVLGPLIKGDRMLQAMPNVSLSLHVLCERASGSISPWAPYINILPHTYSTPLYFTPDEVLLLKGSPAFSEALNQFRNISRQYAYFFKQFQALDDVLKIPIRNMCYDDYRWAVSTVMTRQNQIPNRRGEQNVLSLIPLYDMCNHDNGHITTDYDMKKDCSMCYSLRNFKKGDQVFIFYGERSNADLLVHNGFIFPNNMYDKLDIKLGISKNDHLYAMKSEVLARLSLQPSRLFPLHAGPDPVDSTLVAYLRVFNMDQAALELRLRGENASKLLRQLRDFGLLVNVENEIKCWNFLETRVQLLTKAYPTTKQQDEALLAQTDNKLTPNARMAIQLRLSEKIILENTAEFARLQKAEVESLVREHLEQMNMGMNDLKDDDDDDNLEALSLKPTWEDQGGVQIEEIFDDEEEIPGDAAKQQQQQQQVPDELKSRAPESNTQSQEAPQSAPAQLQQATDEPSQPQPTETTPVPSEPATGNKVQPAPIDSAQPESKDSPKSQEAKGAPPQYVANVGEPAPSQQQATPVEQPSAQPPTQEPTLSTSEQVSSSESQDVILQEID